ncbi:MAG: aminopeptidase P family protein [Gammaproteobacteria bacterium]|nr:aminopeptidase P family protein [Gammaproteobacteria bacterium]
MWDEANIRYFSGFHNLHWPPRTLQCAVLLIPLEGEPVIIIPDFFSGVVEGYTYLSNILLQSMPHATANIRNLPVLVADAVKSLGCAQGRIGIESGHQGGMSIPRPINDIDLFRSSLADAKFVAAADVIWRCRVIKSEAEVKSLKIATQAVVKAYGELVENFHIGMTEKDLSLAVRKSILDHTDDCVAPFIISSSRQIPMADVVASADVKLSAGDRVILEPLPTHKGYWGSCCRVLNVGPLSDEALRQDEYIDSLQEYAIGLVKPGVKTGDLMDAILERTRSDGELDYLLDMAGHGVGLNFQEPPAIAVGEESLIEEGMVLAIECWALDMQRSGAYCYAVEDYVVVTDSGCEVFPEFPKDIRCLPI